MKEKEKILVLDDDVDWLITIKNILKDEYDVVITKSATQARRKVKENHFCFAIIDQKLSNGQTGLDVLSNLRKESRTLPAIICTGFPKEVDEIESRQARALEIIEKGEGINFIDKLKKSINRNKDLKSPVPFLSYQSNDQSDVINLHSKLSLRGFLPWMDIKSIIKGSWMPHIKEAIENSDFFLACFSNTSLRKRKSVFRDELKLALEIQKKLFKGEVFIIPIKLVPCSIPDEFEKFEIVNLFEKEGFSKLISIINTI